MLNLSLASLALSLNTLSIHRPHTSASSYASFRNIRVSNYWNPFYIAAVSTNMRLERSHFSHFLTNAISIDGDNVIYRDDIHEHVVMQLDRDNITVTESTFTDFQCATDGGAVFAVFPGDLFIEQVLFANIVTAAKGGAIFFHGKTLKVKSSCYTSCSATTGLAIYCARSKELAELENSHFFDLSGSEDSIHMNGFVTTIKNVNVSKCQATEKNPAFYLNTVRSNSMSMLVIQGNTGGFIASFENVIPAFEFSNTNMIRNTASNALVNLINYNLVLAHWHFVGNTGTLTSSEQSDVSLSLSQCVFDMAKADLGLPAWVTEAGCQFGIAKTREMAFMETKQCWDQNRYKFVDPPFYKKVVIGCLFGLIFLVGVIFVVTENYIDRKEMKERMAEQQANFDLNEHIEHEDANKDDAHLLKKFEHGQNRQKNALGVDVIMEP